jgi:hypothetical protein
MESFVTEYIGVNLRERKITQENLKLNKNRLTVGLMKPIGFFPTVIRASFTMLRIDATTGAAANVPNA